MFGGGKIRLLHSKEFKESEFSIQMFFLLLMLVVKSPSVESNYVETNPALSKRYLPGDQTASSGHTEGFHYYHSSAPAPLGLSSPSPTIPHSVANQPLLSGNDLLAALFLSAVLRLPRAKSDVGNHPEEVSVNPYITLLLSQYGRYLPIHALGTKGLYHYAAANNYHNNKPFGSYKVYEDAR
uniref:Uncharacterized protein n=2 Tax=Dendroctonus ponderosae TaxID=77166 RepID=A0AAR5NZ42_DENPD